LTPEQRQSTEIIALSIDDQEHLDMMAQRIAKEDGREPTFTMLSDPGHRVIDRYGLLNPSGRGWPHPTSYVIDQRGVVRWKFTEVNYKIRPTNDMILAALAELR
jgi:peroxiredoxin